jgi:carbamoyl-phosphate synthase/aspartate carbamoyltransferase/dihydroorotase
MREPGATHKEDWDSGTAAALAGGFTQVLAMPNTDPPVTDGSSLALALRCAQTKARCDYGQFLGAGLLNMATILEPAGKSAGLKMYLDQTYGPLRLDDMTLWMEHIAGWPGQFPIAVHAEGRSLAGIILISALYDRPVHLCHVSRREEIILIRKAKERGLKITCEVTPHHLTLTKEDIAAIGSGKCEVRPSLAEASDRDALWANLEIIDCFATDHAPHLLAEKEGPEPPPGFPGLETALPLFLTAVEDGRLTIDELVQRMYTNPKRIFNLSIQPETWIEVDLGDSWEIEGKNLHSRCGWTPFENLKVRGRINRVYLRGKIALDRGKVLEPVGSGLNVRRNHLTGLK